MDNGLALTPDEVKGRNMWLVWTGGNDRFWDRLTHDTFGAFDLLKTISSHPSLKNRRSNRWNYLGPDQRALLRRGDGTRSRALRPVARPAPRRLPGRSRSPTPRSIPASPSARAGKNMPVGSYYGEPTGILGLRLFPNPAFDEAAAKEWDPERYYTDPDYYNSKDLVRPYRVGMSCGFCHVGPSPIAPPDDPENPKWENINATVGSQYFWIDRIFAWEAEAGELHVPAGPHPAARHAGHLAGLDRLHQQSAHDERDLQSRPAPRTWPSAGARRSWRAASSTTSSSTTSSTTGR